MKKQHSKDSNSTITLECRARLQKVNDINGYEVLAKDNGWSRQEAGFRAYRTQVVATVPVYEEKNSNGVYQYSLSKVVSPGWERLSVAFYAYKYAHPHSRHHYTTRAVAKSGWKQLQAVFHAFPYECK